MQAQRRVDCPTATGQVTERPQVTGGRRRSPRENPGQPAPSPGAGAGLGEETTQWADTGLPCGRQPGIVHTGDRMLSDNTSYNRNSASFLPPPIGRANGQTAHAGHRVLLRTPGRQNDARCAPAYRHPAGSGEGGPGWTRARRSAESPSTKVERRRGAWFPVGPWPSHCADAETDPSAEERA